jgi:hypothetical protein
MALASTIAARGRQTRRIRGDAAPYSAQVLASDGGSVPELALFLSASRIAAMAISRSSREAPASHASKVASVRFAIGAA